MQTECDRDDLDATIMRLSREGHTIITVTQTATGWIVVSSPGLGIETRDLDALTDLVYEAKGGRGKSARKALQAFLKAHP